jgi:hypothetical protein
MLLFAIQTKHYLKIPATSLQDHGSCGTGDSDHYSYAIPRSLRKAKTRPCIAHEREMRFKNPRESELGPRKLQANSVRRRRRPFQEEQQQGRARSATEPSSCFKGNPIYGLSHHSLRIKKQCREGEQETAESAEAMEQTTGFRSFLGFRRRRQVLGHF